MGQLWGVLISAIIGVSFASDLQWITRWSSSSFSTIRNDEQVINRGNIASKIDSTDKLVTDNSVAEFHCSMGGGPVSLELWMQPSLRLQAKAPILSFGSDQNYPDKCNNNFMVRKTNGVWINFSTSNSCVSTVSPAQSKAGQHASTFLQ